MTLPALDLVAVTAGGVIAAILLPILAAQIRKDFPPQVAPGIPPWAWRYVRLAIFSVIVAYVCLAWWTTTHKGAQLEWASAFLLGFAWEAALEKALKPPLS